ncbi:hypothetical protein HCN44_000288 [Aphidius gifuensis]|uniref:Protein lethal(2)denticleless n=1 Tax=Aphidius gifuensis TaxID=684658 RepID=A0A835CQR7_APHGI|nr:protein lethal(2)denticleless-like [Aphidius gifuensis]KAF7990483.1 hypothetical protein HCN44_000288 [Aphidius gifuensis]
MNIIDSLTRRTSGFESIRDYDIALYRLKSPRDNIYHGITPNTEAPDFNPEPPVFACKFSTTKNYGHILALANEDGKIALQDTSKKGLPNQALDGYQAHCNAIFDVAWMPGKLQLVTASGDQTARLWDVSNSDFTEIGVFGSHDRSVKTVVFRPEDTAVFATGARDGAIMVWDIRATVPPNSERKPDLCIINGHVSKSNKRRRGVSDAQSRTQSITGLTFQDQMTLISGAAGDGLIKVWDLRKNYSVHKKDPLPKYTMDYSGGSTKNGFTSLIVCPVGTTLYASCMDNIIYAYNISSYNKKPFAQYYGHENSTFYVKTCLSSDGRYLASGSSDENAYIWKTNKPGLPLVRLTGHTKEVTCVAWCSVGEIKIVTCSDDSTHRIWKIGPEHKTDNDQVENAGRAEEVTGIPLPRQSSIETTPTISRRRRITDEHTPGSDRTPGDYNSDYNSEIESLDTERKRTHHQMITGSWTDGKYKSTLSPIQENWEPPAKRKFHTVNRRARRLFSPSTSREQSNQQSPDAADNNKRQTPFSPTHNLPNYVEDGTAPHLIQVSPQKSKKNNWLTIIQKERFESKKLTDSETCVAAGSRMTTPAKRNSRSKSAEPRKTEKTSSLYRFFHPSSRDSDKNLFSKNIEVPSQSVENGNTVR